MKCLICDAEVPRISSHLKIEHNGLETRDYILKYKYNLDEVPSCYLPECNEPRRWDSNRTDFLMSCCYEHGQRIKGLKTWESLKSKPEKYKEVCEMRSRDAKRTYENMTEEEKYKFHRSGYDGVGNLPSLGGQALKEYNPEIFSEISLKFWESLSDDEKENHLRKTINGHKKNYSFNTGTKVFYNLQGYEEKALVDLLKEFHEDDIISQPPAIRGSDRMYFPDFLIISTNTIVEVKSEYYLKLDKNIEIKKQMCLNQGYDFRLMVY